MGALPESTGCQPALREVAGVRVPVPSRGHDMDFCTFPNQLLETVACSWIERVVWVLQGLPDECQGLGLADAQRQEQVVPTNVVLRKLNRVRAADHLSKASDEVADDTVD